MSDEVDPGTMRWAAHELRENASVLWSAGDCAKFLEEVADALEGTEADG